MATGYTVDLNSMEAAANQIAETANTVQGLSQNAMQAVSEAQSTGWIDEAADQFNKQMSDWANDQNAMLQAMRGFVTTLQSNASNYQRATNANASEFGGSAG
jgi:WXG100 family type VII secretion target